MYTCLHTLLQGYRASAFAENGVRPGLDFERLCSNREVLSTTARERASGGEYQESRVVGDREEGEREEEEYGEVLTEDVSEGEVVRGDRGGASVESDDISAAAGMRTQRGRGGEGRGGGGETSQDEEQQQGYIHV